MSLELCVLGSGSSGNCAMIRTPAGVVLMDAGLGPRTVAGRMRGTGVSVRDVRAIVLTHLDYDHFNSNWGRAIVSGGIRVHCHVERVEAVRERVGGGPDGVAVIDLIRPFEGAFEPLAGLWFHPFSLAHDAEGSHGFVVEGFGGRVGYATDLGHVPAGLVDHFADLSVLCIEANYEPRMQMESGRPIFLKRRIMGGAGHLSNQQAFEAVRRIFNRCERGPAVAGAGGVAAPQPAVQLPEGVAVIV